MSTKTGTAAFWTHAAVVAAVLVTVFLSLNPRDQNAVLGMFFPGVAEAAPLLTMAALVFLFWWKYEARKEHPQDCETKVKRKLS